MSAAISLAEAADLVHREGHLLDRALWDHWLALYAPEAEFWVPAWCDEHELVEDPATEVSLIHCAARAGLEDRVWRVRSGLSPASAPLPRTSHLIGSVIEGGRADDALEVHSSWTCHVFDLRRRESHVLFGRYEHRLARRGEALAIVRKKIVLMNDRIPAMLDFYCI